MEQKERNPFLAITDALLAIGRAQTASNSDIIQIQSAIASLIASDQKGAFEILRRLSEADRMIEMTDLVQDRIAKVFDLLKELDS